MIKASVVFILNNLGQILLLKRIEGDCWQPGKWGLPGGGVNKGETHEEAVAREIKEETNLSIFAPKVVHVLDEPGYDVKYFITKNFFGTVKIDWEHTDYKWIYPKEINQSECTPNLRNLALKYAS